MKLTVNIVKFIFYPFAIYLCSKGYVSWWVFILFVLNDINVEFTLKK